MASNTDPTMPILLGTIFEGAANILNNSFYANKFHANNNTRLVPDARFPPMIGSFFAAGLFIFGLTSPSPKKIFWLCPYIGLVCMGFGFFTVSKQP
ncbi:hypothetical protein B0J14DRAFT_246561 [Halenospora varia]|nr:hypothetical protein B0J14DRAFT_246561 [Halenospora varia]